MKTLTIKINSRILKNAFNNPCVTWFFGAFFGYLGWLPKDHQLSNYTLPIGVLLLLHLIFLLAMQSQEVED